VRTSGKAVQRLLELTTELGPLQELAIVHTHALAKAKALRQQASHLFPSDKTPLFAEVAPVIGAHIGPGTVGFVAIKARQ
jgi:fatty acid-binding protein DegV